MSYDPVIDRIQTEIQTIQCSPKIRIPLLSSCDISSFLNKFDSFLLDCDGVLWIADTLLPKTVQTINLLHNLGKKVVFVTNNSTKSRRANLEKMKKLGINTTTVSVSDIVPSSFAAALYLSSNHPSVKKAYVIGASGLVEELESLGITCVVSRKNENDAKCTEADFLDLRVDGDIGAVVIGWDCEFNFYKLCYASACLQKKGCVLVACNKDSADKVGELMMPGNGSIVAAVEICTGVKATVVGKESTWLAREITKRFKMVPERTCMIGDRLDTDVVFGNNIGATTALVLTGVCGAEDLQKLTSDQHMMRPTVILPYFGMLSTIPPNKL